MRLKDRALEVLATMVVGDHKAFPYRSSTRITRFFKNCGFNFVHDGSTRAWWTKARLEELNLGTSHTPDLPTHDLLLIITELFDPLDFQEADLPVAAALESLNAVLSHSGLVAYLDSSNRCHVRSTGSGSSSASIPQRPRPLSAEEVAQRQRLTQFLDTATEDEFTERALVPMFQRMGFHRISLAGHREKILEFGKDMWMKYQLPTGHWIYCCAQVKRAKIDSSGTGGSGNVATVLNQARMAIDHAVLDPDINRKVLLDHLFIISAGEITKAARMWLGENLDAARRRHIIFMDRDELLDHSARILSDLSFETEHAAGEDDVPF